MFFGSPTGIRFSKSVVSPIKKAYRTAMAHKFANGVLYLTVFLVVLVRTNLSSKR